MKINYENNRHLSKFKKFVYPDIKDLKNPNILEFGVSAAAMSTGILLDLCERNNGKLYSVDIHDFSSKFNSKNWIFINRKDDDYIFIYDKKLTKLKYALNKKDTLFLIKNNSSKKNIHSSIMTQSIGNSGENWE